MEALPDEIRNQILCFLSFNAITKFVLPDDRGLVDSYCSFLSPSRYSVACKAHKEVCWSGLERIDTPWLRGATAEADLVQPVRFWSTAVSALCKNADKINGLSKLAVGAHWLFPPWQHGWTAKILRSGLLKRNAKKLTAIHICVVGRPDAPVFKEALWSCLPFAPRLSQLTFHDVTFNEEAAFVLVTSPLPSLRKLFINQSRCVGWEVDADKCSHQFAQSIILAPWATSLTHLSLDFAVLRGNFLKIVRTAILSNLKFLNLPHHLKSPELLRCRGWNALDVASIAETGYSAAVLHFGGAPVHAHFTDDPPPWRLSDEDLLSLPYYDAHSLPKLGATAAMSLSVEQKIRLQNREDFYTAGRIAFSPKAMSQVFLTGRMLHFLPDSVFPSRLIELAVERDVDQKLGIDWLARDSSGRSVLDLDRYSCGFKFKILARLPAEQIRALVSPLPLSKLIQSSTVELAKQFMDLPLFSLPEDHESVILFLCSLRRREQLLLLDRSPKWILAVDLLLDKRLLESYFGWENARYPSPASGIIRAVRSACASERDPNVVGAAFAALAAACARVSGTAYYTRTPLISAFRTLRSSFAPLPDGYDDHIRKLVSDTTFQRITRTSE